VFGLEHIIHPVTVDGFLNDYLGEKALYIPGWADKFPNFFDWEQINDQINFSRPSREAIRLIYEKQPLDNNQLANLAEWMVKGATLVINSVQQIDPVVSRFSTSLGRDLNATININCYASYPSKQGFDNHYDGHDVFIIQTSGSKSWKVFEPTRKYPLNIDTIPKGNPPEVDAYLECEMKVGDVLYIPRGHWHYALATEPSVHLTVSNNQRSGIDFMLWLAEQLRDNDEFLRQDFPVALVDMLGGDRSNEAFLEHVEVFRKHLHGIIDDDNLIESFLRFCMVRNPVPRNFQLPALALLKDTIQPGTRFRMSMDQKVLVRFDPEGKNGVLIIRGHILNMNNVKREILEELVNCTNGEVITGDKLQQISSGTPWGDIRMLLVTLFENGILELDSDQ